MSNRAREFQDIRHEAAISQCHDNTPVPQRQQSGNSQAVRIPKALAFDSVDIEVEIERRGDELIVRPAKQKLTGLGAAFRKIGPHFQGFRRDQPLQDQRDWTPDRARTGERRRRETS